MLDSYAHCMQALGIRCSTRMPIVEWLLKKHIRHDTYVTAAPFYLYRYVHCIVLETRLSVL